MNFLRRRFSPGVLAALDTPATLPTAVLRRVNYFRYFPHQLMAVKRFRGPTSASQYLTPAVCYHAFAAARGSGLGRRPYRQFVVGSCARAEGNRPQFPFRLQHFHMAELVVAGTVTQVARLLTALRQQTAVMFAALGVPGTFEVSTDSFFIGGAGARMIQRLKALKQEFRVPVGEASVALASLNNHEDFFTRRFAITTARQQPAFSACLAFGLERLTAYGLLRWGGKSALWPKVLQR